MADKIMLCIYVFILLFILIICLAAGKKNSRYYKRLDKKEHPLKSFYPASSVIYSIMKKILGFKPKGQTVKKIRRLNVKGNIGEETYLYYLKKISIVIVVVLLSSVFGSMFSFSNMQVQYINELYRNDFGKGDAEYDLSMSVDGEEDTINIKVEERKLREDEIIKKMDAAEEDIRKIMLGENSSSDHVTGPLNLISDYEDIMISWEIEDTNVIDYNGNISEKIKENEEIFLNIYAAMTIDETTKVYSMPVVVSSGKLSEREALISQILKDIKDNNSSYEERIVLPQTVNDKNIIFSKPVSHNEYIFLVMGLLCALVIIFGYEKKLDKKILLRNDQMLIDYTEIVSKLSLLFEAGLSIFKAWERIVEDHEKRNDGEEHFAYNEMKMTLEKIKSGMSEKQAYAEFGKTCGLHPYIKLGNILEQNLSKGTKGIKILLKQEVENAFEERKRIARKKGEEASTKLLLPMIIMLVVVIVIIAVPALMTMQL